MLKMLTELGRRADDYNEKDFNKLQQREKIKERPNGSHKTEEYKN